MANQNTPKGGNLVIGYLKEVRQELNHVSWPTRREAIRLTLIVIGISLAAGLYLGGLDYLFTQLMGFII
jgi:preprotein translocase subunit SecE